MGNDFNFMINTMIGNPVTTPPFELELDPITNLGAEHSQQGADINFPLWHSIPQVQSEMSDMDAMRGMFR